MSNQDDRELLESPDDDDGPKHHQLTEAEVRRKQECRELYRLFSEINHAINCFNIVQEIEHACSELREGFFVFAYYALINDWLSSLIRVLDTNSQSFTFWSLDSRFGKKIESICVEKNIDRTRIQGLSGRLKSLRNKVYFHIDKEYAAESDAFVSGLALKDDELNGVAQDLATIITTILCDEYCFPINLSRYDALDVRRILDCVHKSGLGSFTKRKVKYAAGS